MKKYLSTLTLLSALFVIALPQAFAETPAAHASAKKTAKKTTKNKTKKKAASKATAHKKTAKKAPAKGKPAPQAHAKAPAKIVAANTKMPFSSDAEDDDKEPDIGGTKSAELSCELGNRLTIYKNDTDDKHIAIRWNKRINRLTRVSTTTGANRFENHKVGLVWIGIPAKGILLDSKKGQQLANECKNVEQASATATPAPQS
jgi:hypothetical protein